MKRVFSVWIVFWLGFLTMAIGNVVLGNDLEAMTAMIQLAVLMLIAGWAMRDLHANEDNPNTVHLSTESKHRLNILSAIWVGIATFGLGVVMVHFDIIGRLVSWIVS